MKSNATAILVILGLAIGASAEPTTQPATAPTSRPVTSSASPASTPQEDIVSDTERAVVVRAIASKLALTRNQTRMRDPLAGRTQTFTLEKIHEGVHRTAAGTFYACADMRSGGSLYDVDFFVVSRGGRYEVYDSFLHKKDGLDRIRPVKR